MGGQKELEVVNGETLLSRVINRIGLLSKEILIVTNSGHNFQLEQFNRNITIVNDKYPGTAAIGAICTGLEYMKNKFGLVVACDMPFFSVNLLQYMIALSPDFEIVIPKVNNSFEPLHGIYKKSCITRIKELMANNNFTVYKLFETLKTRFVLEEEINKIDPDHFSFINVNTREDLEYANKLAKIVDEQGI